MLSDYAPCLDWLVLSVDSLDPQTLTQIGRTTKGRPIGVEGYLSLCRQVADAGVRLRINTVVSRVNLREDMSAFIRQVKPVRWKVMQVLPVRGQNSIKVDPYIISEEEFAYFIARHERSLPVETALIVETNDDLVGSYAMLDPAGRFFDNTRGWYTYSESILDIGVAEAISQVSISRDKFLARGGDYYLPTA
jgi:radical S-adenosyl methionine domain-containing protein 2